MTFIIIECFLYPLGGFQNSVTVFSFGRASVFLDAENTYESAEYKNANLSMANE